MYKAIEEIGGYAIGDIVPDEKAEVWAKMYGVSPVEKVNEATESVAEAKDDFEKPSDVMLDDYLARNTSVVKKNIASDKLSAEQLSDLLSLEQVGKNRPAVIKAINKKLK